LLSSIIPYEQYVYIYFVPHIIWQIKSIFKKYEGKVVGAFMVIYISSTFHTRSQVGRRPSKSMMTTSATYSLTAEWDKKS
jgi:hypothetical protein